MRKRAHPVKINEKRLKSGSRFVEDFCDGGNQRFVRIPQKFQRHVPIVRGYRADGLSQLAQIGVNMLQSWVGGDSKSEEGPEQKFTTLFGFDLPVRQRCRLLPEEVPRDLMTKCLTIPQLD